ncbi:Deoxythymidylate kinase, partial [Meredithblackwellia eburnea MCA 4105]
TSSLSKPKGRGAFIVFEGLDRSGKSTQVANIVQLLKNKGLDVVPSRFPDRTTTTGGMINSYLLSKTELDDRAIHLLFSANRWERANEILKDLHEGKTVICDRYAFSGIAFSAIKPGLSYHWCLSPDIGLPAPDLVLFLDLSPTAAAQRGGYGSERYETSEVQLAVREVFDRIGKDFASEDQGGRWEKVDASGTMEEVGEVVRSKVEEVV